MRLRNGIDRIRKCRENLGYERENLQKVRTTTTDEHSRTACLTLVDPSGPPPPDTGPRRFHLLRTTSADPSRRSWLSYWKTLSPKCHLRFTTSVNYFTLFFTNYKSKDKILIYNKKLRFMGNALNHLLLEGFTAIRFEVFISLGLATLDSIKSPKFSLSQV